MTIKRKLTIEEITSICDTIPLHKGIPEDSAYSIRDGVISTIRSQLEEVLIYPENIDKLREIIESEYYNSVLQPGEMVGVQAATSIGEPVTQMSLNAFHFSGISTVGIASGVPRVEEIMNASKIQKSYGMTLTLYEPLSIKEIRRLVYHEVTQVYLCDMITEISVEYTPRISSLSETDQLWYSLYMSLFSNEIMNDHEEFLFPWRIRLHINKQKMFYHTVSCVEIAQKIEASYRDLYTIASPDNIGIIDVFIDFSQMKLKKKEEEEILHIDHKEDICIRNIIIPFLQDILVAGIADVEDVYIHEEKGKWVIDTQGSNLAEIFKNPNFDFRHCLSSDIWEIKKILGIEATRQFIINEFYKVLAQSGASIGRRHIELLADSMTFQGKISSVNRYGIDRNETGPLAKASFEESVNNFFIAAINGETDQMGVSSSVMAGKLAPIGSGYFDVMLDMKSAANALPLRDPLAEYKMKHISAVPFPTSKTPLRTPYNVPLPTTQRTPYEQEIKPIVTPPKPAQPILYDTLQQQQQQQQPSIYSQTNPYEQQSQPQYKSSLYEQANPYEQQSQPQYKSSLYEQANPYEQKPQQLHQSRKEMSTAMNTMSSHLSKLSTMVKPIKEYNTTATNLLYAPSTFTKHDGEQPPVSYMNPGHSQHKSFSKPSLNDTTKTSSSKGKRSKPKELLEEEPQKVSWVKRKPKVTVQFSDDP